MLHTPLSKSFRAAQDVRRSEERAAAQSAPQQHGRRQQRQRGASAGKESRPESRSAAEVILERRAGVEGISGLASPPGSRRGEPGDAPCPAGEGPRSGGAHLARKRPRSGSRGGGDRMFQGGAAHAASTSARRSDERALPLGSGRSTFSDGCKFDRNPSSQRTPPLVIAGAPGTVRESEEVMCIRILRFFHGRLQPSGESRMRCKRGDSWRMFRTMPSAVCVCVFLPHCMCAGAVRGNGACSSHLYHLQAHHLD